jgi:hypothetical protein
VSGAAGVKSYGGGLCLGKRRVVFRFVRRLFSMFSCRLQVGPTFQLSGRRRYSTSAGLAIGAGGA